MRLCPAHATPQIPWRTGLPRLATSTGREPIWLFLAGSPSCCRRTLSTNADHADASSAIGYRLILRSAWLNHDPTGLAPAPPQRNSSRHESASRLQDQLLHAPVQQLRHVQHVLRWTRHRVDPAELFWLLAGLAEHAEHLALEVKLVDAAGPGI